MANSKYALDRERRKAFDSKLTSAFHDLLEIKHLTKCKKRDLIAGAELIACFIAEKPEKI